MILSEGNLKFDFTDAVDVIKFDEQDKSHPNYHGNSCLKAVDFVVELNDTYLFVEIKDYSDPQNKKPVDGLEQKDFDKLKHSLAHKCIDSFFYRANQKKLDKPIYYLCLVTLEKAQNSILGKYVKGCLNFTGWTDPVIKSVNVINIAAWNRNFPKWPVKRI